MMFNHHKSCPDNRLISWGSLTTKWQLYTYALKKLQRVTSKQIGVHEASLCVLLVLEILRSSTKLPFLLTLCTWCVFHVFGCALSVYHLSAHWVHVCLLRVYVIITQNGFKSAHREHKNLLHTRKQLFARLTRDELVRAQQWFVVRARAATLSVTEFYGGLFVSETWHLCRGIINNV